MSLLRLTVAEAALGATVNGAAALGLGRAVGQLTPGASTDLALFAIEDIRELPYRSGDRRCRGSWVRGKPCHQFELGVV